MFRLFFVPSQNKQPLMKGQLDLWYLSVTIECLIRLHISSKFMYDFGKNGYRKIDFSHINAFRIKFDLAVKEVKVN